METVPGIISSVTSTLRRTEPVRPDSTTTGPPPVVITEIQKLNAPAQLATPYENVRDLKLNYRDDVIAFRFAGLDYAAPAENRYSYMLEGFDADWVDAGTQRRADHHRVGIGHAALAGCGASQGWRARRSATASSPRSRSPVAASTMR